MTSIDFSLLSPVCLYCKVEYSDLEFSYLGLPRCIPDLGLGALRMYIEGRASSELQVLTALVSPNHLHDLALGPRTPVKMSSEMKSSELSLIQIMELTLKVSALPKMAFSTVVMF